MDFLQYFIQKLVGLDYWLDKDLNGERTLDGATNEDVIFKFLYADSVQKVFRALVALFIVLLIIFTIFAIIKNEWDYMTGDGSKGNSKAAIFRSAIKAIALVIVFPVLLVIGIVSSNAILASIINAINVDMSETFGSKIFSVSAMSANKYRAYVDKNTYLPTSDKVTFYLTDGASSSKKLIVFGSAGSCTYGSKCGERHQHYTDYKAYLNAIKSAESSGYKYTVDSIFDPLVPKEQTNFSGFCFRIDDENENKEYFFVQANSQTKYPIYYYLRYVLGAKILNENGLDWGSGDGTSDALLDGIKAKKFTGDCDGCYISKLNIARAPDVVRNVCRNSWNYSLLYINPGKSLVQSLSSEGGQPLADYNLGSAIGTGATGAILYNSSEIAPYFDGGQFGVVQSRTEYAVMADVVDFMCDNTLTFYIMDATSTEINWNYYSRYVDGDNDPSTPDVVDPTSAYHVESKWISDKINDELATIGLGNDKFLSSENAGTLVYDGGTSGSYDTGDIKALTFLTEYAKNRTLAAENSEQIIYTARYDVGDESQGSRYIICLKSDDGKFYPLVNGKDFTVGNREYRFKSDHYASDYKGVVWAKGTFDTNTVDGYVGNPTYLKNSQATELDNEEVVTDADGSYYYRYDDANKKLKLYNFYTRVVMELGQTPYLATYNNGNIYRSGALSAGFDAGTRTLTTPSSSYNYCFTSEYVLKDTGVDYNFGGTNYNLYATESSGFCYMLFENGGSFYLPYNNPDTDTTLSLGSSYSGGNIYPCYLNGNASKPASDLAVRTIDLALGGGNLAMSKEVTKSLKNTFSLFTNVGSNPEETSTGQYFGTFTKKIAGSYIPAITGEIAVTKTWWITENTKKLETYWGSTYYNIDVSGVCLPSAGVTLGSAWGGKYNASLQVEVNSAIQTMLKFYDSAKTSNAVSCYRYQIENFSGNTFGFTLIEFNVHILAGVFELKTGTVQQISNSLHESHKFVYAGESEGITFDYFFDQNVGLHTFYAASKIMYPVLLISAIMIIKVLMSALWGVIKRFYMITLYYLAMPVAASTIPIDDGSRFTQVRKRIMNEVLSTYGVLIGLNVFFVLLAPIKDISSTIFTEEAIANSGSYFLKKLPISAKVLNTFVYILFLLVAFTLIDELPGLVQKLVGEGDDLKSSGEATKKGVGSTLQSASKTISGQGVIDTWKKGKEMLPGAIPGSALAGKIWKGTKDIAGTISGKFGEGYSKAKGGGGEGGGGNGQPQGNSRQQAGGVGEEELENKFENQQTPPTELEEELDPMNNPIENSRTNVGETEVESGDEEKNFAGLGEIDEQMVLDLINQALDERFNGKTPEGTQGLGEAQADAAKQEAAKEVKELENGVIVDETNLTDEAKNEIQEMNQDAVVDQEKVDNEANAEFEALNEKLVVTDEEAKGEVDKLNKLEGVDNESVKTGVIDKLISKSKHADVINGLLGKDQDTVKGAMLGQAGKVLKAGALVALAASPLGIVGAAAAAGSYIVGKKVHGNVTNAIHRYREADEATKAKMIREFGGKALKVAGVATVGIATGGLGGALLAGGAMTGYLAVKDEKYRKAHPEEFLVKNAGFGGQFTAVQQAGITKRAKIVEKAMAMNGMDDVQKAALLEGKNIIINGSEVSYDASKKKFMLGTGDDAKEATGKDLERIHSRLYSSLSEEDRQNAAKEIAKEEKFNNADSEATAKMVQIAENNLRTQGGLTDEQIANMSNEDKLQKFNTMSVDEKKEALKNIKRDEESQEVQNANNTKNAQRAEVVEKALSKMSAEDKEKFLSDNGVTDAKNISAASYNLLYSKLSDDQKLNAKKDIKREAIVAEATNAKEAKKAEIANQAMSNMTDEEKQKALAKIQDFGDASDIADAISARTKQVVGINATKEAQSQWVAEYFTNGIESWEQSKESFVNSRKIKLKGHSQHAITMDAFGDYYLGKQRIGNYADTNNERVNTVNAAVFASISAETKKKETERQVKAEHGAVTYENGEYKVNGVTATEDQMKIINARLYSSLTDDQKAQAVVDINNANGGGSGEAGVGNARGSGEAGGVDEERVRQISREEAEKLIDQLDAEPTIDETKLEADAENELKEIEQAITYDNTEADTEAVNKEYDELESLNEADAKHKKLERKSRWENKWITKVARGLMGKDQDTVKGAHLANLGKFMKGGAMLALAASPLGLAGVGSFIIGKKLYGNAKNAVQRYRAADEKTKAQMIRNFGGKAFKVAGVATLGLATGGAGLAAVAAAGMTGYIAYNDIKYKRAHPEEFIVKNAQLKKPLTMLTDEQRERRANIARAAIMNMSDDRRDEIVAQINKGKFKSNGKKVKATNEGGSISFKADGKTVFSTDAIYSRVFSSLTEEEKKAILTDESKSKNVNQRIKQTDSRKAQIAKTAIASKLNDQAYADIFNKAYIGIDKDVETGDYNSIAKISNGKLKLVSSVDGSEREATEIEEQEIYANIYDSNNEQLLSRKDKVTTLAKMNRAKMQGESQETADKKDKIAYTAIASMKLDDANNFLKTNNIKLDGQDVALDGKNNYLVDGKIATDEQKTKINAQIYANLSKEQKADALIASGIVKGRVVENARASGAVASVDRAEMEAIAEAVYRRHNNSANVSNARTQGTQFSYATNARTSQTSNSSQSSNTSQTSNTSNEATQANQEVNVNAKGKYVVGKKRLSNKQSRDVNDQIYDGLTDAEKTQAIIKANEFTANDIAHEALASRYNSLYKVDKARAAEILQNVNLGDGKKVTLSRNGTYMVNGVKATKAEAKLINKQVYAVLSENEKIQAVHTANKKTKSEIAGVAMKTTLSGSRKNELLSNVDINKLSGFKKKKKKKPFSKTSMGKFMKGFMGKDVDTVAGAHGANVAKFAKAGALIALAASPAGLLGVGSVLVGKNLIKDGRAGYKRYKSADEKTKAQMIREQGKVFRRAVAVGALTVATGGGLGAAAIMTGATTGVLFASGRISKVRKAGSPANFANRFVTNDTSSGDSYGADFRSFNITSVHSADQTKQLLVYDKSKIAAIVRDVIETGRFLDDKEKMQVGAHYVNYGSIIDENFVPDIPTAYRNVVVNKIGTVNGRIVAGTAINSYETANNVSLEDVLFKNNLEAKLAIYKSMMTEEQLDTLNTLSRLKGNESVAEQLKVIESVGSGGMAMKLGVEYDARKGLVFNVNGHEVKDIGKNVTNKTNSVNNAMADALTSGQISSSQVMEAVYNTNSTNVIMQALAKNYALGVDYSANGVQNIDKNSYHHEVLELARANEDINAEAILAYLKKEESRLNDFKRNINKESQDMTDEQLLMYIKDGIRNPSSGILPQLKPSDYAFELSQATSRHVADGSFKVQAFDLIPRSMQMDIADRVAANLTAMYAGKSFGYTDSEKATDFELSKAEFGDKELVHTYLKASFDETNELNEALIGKYYGITDESGAFDESSKEAQTLLAEAKKINAEAFNQGYTPKDIAIAYAKAKALGQEKNFETFIGKNDSDAQVIEALMNNSSIKTTDAELENMREHLRMYQNLYNYEQRAAQDARAFMDKYQQKLIETGIMTKDGENVTYTKQTDDYGRELSLTEEIEQIDADSENISVEFSEKERKELIDAVIKTKKGSVENSLYSDEDKKQFRTEYSWDVDANINGEAGVRKELETYSNESLLAILREAEAVARKNDTSFHVEESKKHLAEEEAARKQGSRNVTEGAKERSIQELANIIKSTLSSDQITKLEKDGSENGLLTLTTSEQNEILAKLAQKDEGAMNILKSNSVDVNSNEDISKFLNSSAGAALRERLMSMASASLFTIKASKNGLDEAEIFDIIRKSTIQSSSSTLYEQQQGNLISKSQVKEYLSNNASSADVETLLNNAAAKFSLLTKAEQDKIYNKVEKEVKDKGLPETAHYALYQQYILEAKMNLLANGGLARQRAVAEVIMNNESMRNKAAEAYKNDVSNTQKAELANISEVDRNNFLFNSYLRLFKQGSSELNKIEKAIKNSDANYEAKADNRKAIENLNQAEMDSLIKGMEDEGVKIVENARKQIIDELNKNGILTTIPDVNKMTKQEKIAYDNQVASYHRAWTSQNHPDVFANLYRNSTLVNDNESIDKILAGDNHAATKADIEKARIAALRNNKEFYNRAIVEAMSLKENSEELAKIVNKLKENGTDYESLSTEEKGDTIEKLLKNKDFVTKNKINDAKLNESIESRFKHNVKTATNYDVKMGMDPTAINKYISANEAMQQVLFRIGAFHPHKAFNKKQVVETRTKHILSHYEMRRIFCIFLMRELYSNPQLKKMITKEILDPSSAMFKKELDQKLNRMKKQGASPEQIAKAVEDYLKQKGDSLTGEFGEHTLLKQNQEGKWEFKDNHFITKHQDIIEKSVESDNRLRKPLKKAESSILSRLFGGKHEKNDELDAMFEQLRPRVDARTQTIADSVLTKRMPDLINSFMRGDSGVSAIIASKSERILKDKLNSERNVPIYQNANTATKADIARLSAQISALQKQRLNKK